MANIKICNLDLIAPAPARELVLGGVTYKVEPLTVEKFVEFNQLRQSIGADSSLQEGLKVAKGIIKSSIPEMSEEIMDRMTIAQLQLVVAFINDEIPEDVLTGAQTPENNNKKEEKEEGAKAEDNSGN